MRSSSRATFATVFPDSRTRRTASALNSGVNERRVRFVTLWLMDTSNHDGRWKVSTKTGEAYSAVQRWQARSRDPRVHVRLGLAAWHPRSTEDDDHAADR